MTVLEAMERVVTDTAAAPFLRVFDRWVLLHQGLSPTHMSVSGPAFVGKLEPTRISSADSSWCRRVTT